MPGNVEEVVEFVENNIKPMSYDDCSNFYSDWSEKYEADMEKASWGAYKNAATCFSALGISKDAEILDCGAGTGLLGQALANDGYINIRALDGCPRMLEQAKKKNVYKGMTVAFVTPDQPLPFEEGTFDALVMAGVFCPGHFPLKVGTFRQLLRLLKKDGIMAWAQSNPERYADRDQAFADNGFYKVLDSVFSQGLADSLPGYPKICEGHRNGETGLFFAIRKL